MGGKLLFNDIKTVTCLKLKQHKTCLIPNRIIVILKEKAHRFVFVQLAHLLNCQKLIKEHFLCLRHTNFLSHLLWL